MEAGFEGRENPRLVSENKGGNDLGREHGDKQQAGATFRPRSTRAFPRAVEKQGLQQGRVCLVFL